MTDQELDAIMRRVLADCLKRDLDGQDGNAAFEPSPQHKRQMRSMLRDPLKWASKKSRPVWKTAAQRAAVVFLAVSLGLGTVMASSPTARAAFVRWVTERYETYITYRYLGEGNPDEMPQYRIAALPDGFVETERTELPRITSVTYENEAGDVIYFEYGFVAQGSVLTFYTENAEIYDYKVDYMNGLFFESKIPGGLNTFTWIDEEQSIQFDINAAFGYLDILHMAEGISLVKTTK